MNIAKALLLVTMLTFLTGSVAGCGDWPCKKGKPCGGACIEKSDTCHK
jgi:hypothetical protein